MTYKYELELEQIYKYMKKNQDVSEADIRKELMFSEAVVSNVFSFLLGAKKIEMHRIIGRSKLYKVTKQVIKNDD